MAYFWVHDRAVASYLALSVLYIWAISGTRGSSGLGSVSREQIDRRTCKILTSQFPTQESLKKTKSYLCAGVFGQAFAKLILDDLDFVKLILNMFGNFSFKSKFVVKLGIKFLTHHKFFLLLRVKSKFKNNQFWFRTTRHQNFLQNHF